VRGWCFKNNWRNFDRTGFASLMEGYQAVRKLTRAEKKSLPAAIKFAILERALSFAGRYVNFSHDRADQSFARDSLLRQLPLIEKNKDFIIKTLK
jgi:Ser/Thr protein kinase RdoA (MazF antagonist)